MEFDEYPTSHAMTGFFIAVTVVFNIVMLNILIAIVSTSYEEVTEKQVLA